VVDRIEQVKRIELESPSRDAAREGARTALRVTAETTSSYGREVVIHRPTFRASRDRDVSKREPALLIRE